MQSPSQLPLHSNLHTFPTVTKDNAKITVLIILGASFCSLLFISSLPSQFSSKSSSTATDRLDPYLFPSHQSDTNRIPTDPTPPSIAYLISGSDGDSARILRLLYATYHPKNQYLLHLDAFASDSERNKLALAAQSISVFRAAKNVDVIGKPDFANMAGSSAISATLHGASILMKLSEKWEWFISLRAGDYPLVTQDDLLHIFSYLPKDLNFVSHSSYIGWKESRKVKPIIVDSGLYLKQTANIFHATQNRPLPSAFRLYTGPSFTILSRQFMEHCILGTDNLPRILLMYFANTPSSLSNYFPTVICNTREFINKVINYNFQHQPYDLPTNERPRTLNSSQYDAMVQSGAAFATGFQADDPTLDRIDKEILRRVPGRVVPGGWCLGSPGNSTCLVWGKADILRPSSGASRVEKPIVELLTNGNFRTRQCIEE